MLIFDPQPIAHDPVLVDEVTERFQPSVAVQAETRRNHNVRVHSGPRRKKITEAQLRVQVLKVFCFFFSKKKTFFFQPLFLTL